MIRSVPSRAFHAGGAVSLPLAAMHRWLPFGLRLMQAAAHADDSRSVMAGLLRDALPAWQALAKLLGQPSLLREQGHFVLWESPASAAKGLQAWRHANIGTTSFREVTAAERSEFAQLLNVAPAGGIRFEGTAQIADPIRLRDSLLSALRGNACEFVRGVARAIRQEGAQAIISLTDGNVVAADLVIIAAGVRSAALLEPLGVRVPMIAERGYHIQSAVHRWPDLPPVVFEDRSLIVTRFESALRAASFLEFTSADAPPDARKWRRLHDHVTALGIPLLGTTQEWFGSRPTLPDYLPVVGRLRDHSNVYYAFGHNHLGLTLAPLTSQLLTAFITNHSPKLDLTPLRLERFG
jgi:D-amino-acid dehydrogenase